MDSIKNLRAFIRKPGEGSAASIYYLDGDILSRLCEFRWSQKAKRYKIEEKSEEFKKREGDPYFEAYLAEFYDQLMAYHIKLASLRHEIKLIEELFTTIKNEPERGQK